VKGGFGVDKLMDGPRHRRPKWTTATLLLIVGWSSVVVWLNVLPRRRHHVEQFAFGDAIPQYVSEDTYGWPEKYSGRFSEGRNSPRLLFRPALDDTWRISKWTVARALIINTVVGLIAVVVLTFASRYLLRRMVSGLRAVFGKPPPAKEESSPESKS
jgi:hypothetical protein